MIVMVVAVGFIFAPMFKVSKINPQGIPVLQKFDWNSMKMAIYVTAPALILHELAHKFVALGFGYEAVFHAAYLYLAIGIAMRLLKFPFIFFVPAFVSISSNGVPLIGLNPLADALISVAGPLMNLLLWLVPKYILKFNANLKRQTKIVLMVTSKINMFLFFINMIPIGPFDGAHFFKALFSMF